ncbi:MAG: M24 family metallopeptidase, partial [Gemmatimonadota bacterium]
DLRAVKDESEIDAIGAAARVAETALEGLLTAVEWHSEPTELDVATALEHELRRAGSEGLPFEVIVAGGERTSLPHAAPSSRRVRTGDLVLIDFGAIVDGYCSDITRTFIVGDPADWQTEIHGRVLEAQAAAIEAIAPGASGVEVDRAARDCLAAHDLDRYFGHSTGHGIGLEVHEEPRLSTRSEDVLEPGNVVTVEPGVYLPGRGGVRIEDDVAVTRDGSRVLTSIRRDLVRV